MSSEEIQMSIGKQKTPQKIGSTLVIVAAIFAAIVLKERVYCLHLSLRLFGEMAFLVTCYSSWRYQNSELYMSFLRRRWQELPVLDAEPVPELTLENFSRERLLELSNYFAKPIVIRNALNSSAALRNWNPAYLKEKYGKETVVVREMQGSSVTVQHRKLDTFFAMKEKGRNVSVIASSAIFYRSKVMKTEVESAMERLIYGPWGDKIDAWQFFITPGGRSFYHSEMGSNVFRQIEGRKTWNVIDPMYNFYMCPFPVITATSVNTCIQFMPEDERERWTTKLPRLTVTLEPGDLFINSPWWWHDVQSPVEGSAISVAGRMKNILTCLYANPVVTLNAVATILRTGTGNPFDPAFELSLEENIVNSWQAECRRQKRIDCITDP